MIFILVYILVSISCFLLLREVNQITNDLPFRFSILISLLPLFNVTGILISIIAIIKDKYEDGKIPLFDKIVAWYDKN